MLKDLAAKYYQQGYNCAETIIRAGNEYYNLELDENAFRITGAFGGGLQVGDVCGALTGSACVVSAKYIETKAHDCPDLKPLMHFPPACARRLKRNSTIRKYAA